ncbi:MAG: hypothetical protein ABR949_10170 [Candidatus Aquilonibacter sp.]|jgi:Holliday junction resolvase
MSDYVGVSPEEEAEIIAEYKARTGPAGQALLRTLFEQRSIPRGDELFTHGSDLTTCLRAVAYRRRGVKPEPYSPRELAKFAIGHGYEKEVAQTLRDAGHKVIHDPKNFVVSAFGIDIIHPDIFVDNAFLVECKTTDGGATYPKSDRERAGQPKEVSTHHAIQAATNALALKVDRAVVLVKHAGIGDRGHEEVAHDVDPQAHRALIESLAREVVELTGPEMPLPPAEPKPQTIAPYNECDYCRFHLCERNPRYEQEIP